eukprot:TRINITY_DN1373_c0_g1_i6.p2 TRINITY_DN1373_c0_g1~~TRINITY_DN1373_c0_g1_i6.p2  ORF type:complete len:211 (+),score=42.76 TRINITY_DN1373_c0_g1_i6:40-672(+)
MNTLSATSTKQLSFSPCSLLSSVALTRPNQVQRSCQFNNESSENYDRRNLLSMLGFTAALVNSNASTAAEGGLCDSDCVAALEGIEMQTTSSGLQFKDIVVGKGPQPKVGFQVVCNYVAMTPDGRVFDSSIEKGYPYDIRVGAEAVVAGLDEGLLSMKVGGLRRLYVPGNLSFPNGLKSGPGRPRILPNSPVVFDVQLLYVPGLDDEDEE